jgi:hypothetical protein
MTGRAGKVKDGNVGGEERRKKEGGRRKEEGGRRKKVEGSATVYIESSTPAVGG